MKTYALTYILAMWLVISIFFNAVTVSVLYDNEEEINHLKHKECVEATQLNEAVQYIYENDVLMLQSANEQLIKYAEPKSLNKAIQNTPLPKRG